MHNSQSVHNDSLTGASNAIEMADGKFFPSITIHDGATIAGIVIHRNSFPKLVFEHASVARTAGAEMAKYWLAGFKIQGAKKSENLGRTYAYVGRSSPGDTHSWEARLYRGGVFVGAIGGAILDGQLRETALDEMIRLQIENRIDSGFGFQP